MRNALTIFPVVFAAIATTAMIATPSAAADLASYRAVYDMALGATRSSSSVQSVDGRSVYMFRRHCDGWQTIENYIVSFGGEHGVAHAASHSETWESAGGDSFSFSFNQDSSDKGRETYSGFAQRTARGGEAQFIGATGQSAIPLPAPTVFPAAYTSALLDDAARGSRIKQAMVFIGGEAREDALYEVTAVIGTRKTGGGALLPPALAQNNYWPMVLSFFPAGSLEPVPEYEIRYAIQDNGVIRSYSVDYGTFVMRARLHNIEALAEPRC